MLKNPVYFDFYLIAANVAVISAAYRFRVFHIWKLNSEPQISLDSSLKWILMQRNEVHKLFIIMIDLTQSKKYPKNMVTQPFVRSCRENPSFKSSALILSDFRNYWLCNGALEDTVD